MNLFEAEEQRNRDNARPLAARMRPRTLDEFAGQQHILGEGKLLRRMLDADHIGSVIFYGPPGIGDFVEIDIGHAATKAPIRDETPRKSWCGNLPRSPRRLPPPPPRR